MEPDTVRTPQAARQGKTEVGLRYVLGYGLALAVVTLGAVAVLYAT